MGSHADPRPSFRDALQMAEAAAPARGEAPGRSRSRTKDEETRSPAAGGKKKKKPTDYQIQQTKMMEQMQKMMDMIHLQGQTLAAVSQSAVHAAETARAAAEA
eukprot:5179208-Pyramimonas_sp.AAC.1